MDPNYRVIAKRDSNLFLFIVIYLKGFIIIHITYNFLSYKYVF